MARWWFGSSLILALSSALSAQSPDPVATKVAAPDRALTELVESVQGEKPFQKGEFKSVRGAFSRYFETAHEEQIKSAFGKKHAEIMSWLNQNTEIKETLFTAIDPETDDVEKALTVFRELYELGPDKLKTYSNVAIACSVVWDNPKNVYDYRGHQIRTQSTLPDGVLQNRHIQNYQYLTNLDAAGRGQLLYLPWEMLVHVVNHFTPVPERNWAVGLYQKKRPMIGKNYFDVEYDKEMLRTEMMKGPGKGDCRLAGKPYTLENLRNYGGVCAQQADYSSRVAKSLAIPAEYVGGEGNSGGRHAWVMWVEVKTATKDKLDVSLMSEGRYLIDQYYIGQLQDPKTGEPTTDRAVELYLASVVLSPGNGRQADLLMRVFPKVKDAKQLTPRQQIDYVRKVLDVFPYSEKAWLERASLIKGGVTTDVQAAVNVAETAFRVFHNYPDYSWKVADDLLTPVKDKRVRAVQFEKLVTRYEQLGRPDLACEARLKLTEYQVEAKDFQKAADGLSKTIVRFPSEGRYVPKMLTELQKVCAEYKGGPDKLTKFYLQVLPLIPATRGNEISDYCVKVHTQAIEFFKQNGKVKEAQAAEQRLAQIKRAGR